MEQMSFTDAELNLEDERLKPLAARMRPRNLSEYVGQSHLIGPGNRQRSDNVHDLLGTSRSRKNYAGKDHRQ